VTITVTIISDDSEEMMATYSMHTYTEKRQSRPSIGMTRTTTVELTIRCIWTKSNRLESPEWKRDDSYDQSASVWLEDDQSRQLWRDVDKTTTEPIRRDEDCRPYDLCGNWKRWRLQWIQTLKKSRSQHSNTRWETIARIIGLTKEEATKQWLEMVRITNDPRIRTDQKPWIRTR